ncbi:MAG: hypothetical protein ACD_61C00256G0003 [uncultured bacterium]|nr:MAG: hypothetical protein ACD_61C00256G0003 [uncultured bacterium]
MDKKYIRIGLGIFLVVALICSLIYWLTSLPTRQQASLLSTPTVLATATPVMTPTPTQTAIPAAPGNIWEVVAIEENKIYENGFHYDVATFKNLNDPSLIILARCAEPGWPQPEIGDRYVLNQYGVLIPIEGIGSLLQRFLVIEDTTP